MATLQSRNKKREDKDPEFKQKRHNSFQSFFAKKKPAATTLPKPLTPSLGPASLPAAADEIMVETLAVILPISTQSGGSSHLQEHNPPAGSYPSLPMRLLDRKENEIYFNTGTSRAERWSLRKKVCVCLCDLTGSVVCRGNHPFSRCGAVKAATQTPLTPSLGAVQSGAPLMCNHRNFQQHLLPLRCQHLSHLHSEHHLFRQTCSRTSISHTCSRTTISSGGCG